MSYYPETESHIKDNVKVVLDLSNYATKKELDHSTGVDTSDLASKNDVIALKAEAGKLEINKFVIVPTSLNIFFKKAGDLDVGKLKTGPIDLKQLSDAVDDDVSKIRNLTPER